jgi:hypothetical protein
VWPLENPIPYTIIWILVIVVIFLPLSVRRYARPR